MWRLISCEGPWATAQFVPPLDPALITGGVARNSQWRAFRVGAYDEMAKASRAEAWGRGVPIPIEGKLAFNMTDFGEISVV